MEKFLDIVLKYSEKNIWSNLLPPLTKSSFQSQKLFKVLGNIVVVVNTIQAELYIRLNLFIALNECLNTQFLDLWHDIFVVASKIINQVIWDFALRILSWLHFVVVQRTCSTNLLGIPKKLLPDQVFFKLFVSVFFIFSFGFKLYIWLIASKLLILDLKDLQLSTAFLVGLLASSFDSHKSSSKYEFLNLSQELSSFKAGFLIRFD